MPKLSQINRAVEDEILKRFGYLKGHVNFDTVFHSANDMATCFLTTVSMNSAADYKEVWSRCTSDENKPHWVQKSKHILRDLLIYQADEDNEFELDRTRFLIGDGDDSGAVWETGPWSMTLWVRILELGQEKRYG